MSDQVAEIDARTPRSTGAQHCKVQKLCSLHHIQSVCRNGKNVDGSTTNQLHVYNGERLDAIDPAQSVLT